MGHSLNTEQMNQKRSFLNREYLIRLRKLIDLGTVPGLHPDRVTLGTVPESAQVHNG